MKLSRRSMIKGSLAAVPLSMLEFNFPLKLPEEVPAIEDDLFKGIQVRYLGLKKRFDDMGEYFIASFHLTRGSVMVNGCQLESYCDIDYGLIKLFSKEKRVGFIMRELEPAVEAMNMEWEQRREA